MSRRSTFLDPNDPFYRPLWRRVAIVALMIGWGLFELSRGAGVWAAGFLLGGIWVGAIFWQNPPSPEPGPSGQDDANTTGDADGD